MNAPLTDKRDVAAVVAAPAGLISSSADAVVDLGLVLPIIILGLSAVGSMLLKDMPLVCMALLLCALGFAYPPRNFPTRQWVLCLVFALYAVVNVQLTRGLASLAATAAATAEA